MKLKSLLLGPAVAAVAATGARAADAIIIAEPEPMEYVRICDVYGTGFFYILGTETCLRIDGYVRYQMVYSSNNRHQGPTGGPYVNHDHLWGKLARVVSIPAFRLTVRSSTTAAKSRTCPRRGQRQRQVKSQFQWHGRSGALYSAGRL